MRGVRLAAVGGCMVLTSLSWAPPALAGSVGRLPAGRLAAASCQLQQSGSPASQMTSEPWPQQRLNFTDAWKLTRGQGVVVAVVDSGVDGTHPQLRGHVQSYDVTKTGPQDCVGHGTQVAGIIGAQDLRARGIPFLGVAPGARLISIKGAVSDQNNDPHWVAAAMRQAADRHAKVINVSSQTPNYPFLKAAVEYAQRKDALIVAAAGNVQDERTQTVHEAYPASYPGVMSVGGTTSTGALGDFSNSQTHVTITGPGKDIISTWPQGTYFNNTGTSFAAPYVAGTAALVRAYYPGLTAKQVKYRIEHTADGGTVKGTGAGQVNPLRAVTAVMGGETGQVPAQTAVRRVSIAQPSEGDRFGRTLGLSLAGGALVVAAGIAVAGAVIPAGRRRNGSAGPAGPNRS
ncbi:MAG: peptidase and in kexin sedolisin [Streptosporangiaceae bacterium]|nr:peptidase and in kexin sedolisin [Streptosporangiaceae bacterium]